LSTPAGEAIETERTGAKLPTRDEALKMLAGSGADPKVIRHCIAVSELAVKIAKLSKKPVDVELVEIGGILHDIGRSKTHGITHAVEGAKIAKSLGLPDEIVKIIMKHIGAGLDEAAAEKFKLPKNDYMPKTIEEKIIAHADNLLSGAKRIPVAETVERLVRAQDQVAAKRMLALHKELSELCGIDLDKI